MKRDYRVLLAGMVAVALAFGVSLTLGFRLRSRYPDVSDSVFGAVVALVLVGVAAVVMVILVAPWWPAKREDNDSGRRPDPDDDSPPTGYEITLEEFRQLISEPSSQPLIASRVQDWYGYRILGQGAQTAIRSQDGDVVGIRTLHYKIQMDPTKQRSIYGVAMDLWR